MHYSRFRVEKKCVPGISIFVSCSPIARRRPADPQQQQQQQQRRRPSQVVAVVYTSMIVSLFCEKYSLFTNSVNICICGSSNLDTWELCVEHCWFPFDRLVGCHVNLAQSGDLEAGLFVWLQVRTNYLRWKIVGWVPFQSCVSWCDLADFWAQVCALIINVQDRKRANADYSLLMCYSLLMWKVENGPTH